jgi:hypothetical protein
MMGMSPQLVREVSKTVFSGALVPALSPLQAASTSNPVVDVKIREVLSDISFSWERRGQSRPM